MNLITEKRLEWLRAIDLGSGNHGSVESGVCAMEAAAYIAGEPHSDKPTCVCPVITRFMVSWNDSLRSDADRNRLLKPLLPRILGTRSTPEIEHKRALMALDWLIRTHTVAWLDMVDSCKLAAESLRALPPVTDDNAAKIGVLVRAAAKQAAAARDAAGDAAWDAAWDAARDAARDAAWAAAGDAAGDAAWAAAWAAAGDAAWAAAWAAARDAAGAAAWAAAWAAARAAAWAAAGAAAGDAAWDAAWDAAGDAAWAKLQSTVDHLQQSAVSLVEAMAAIKP